MADESIGGVSVNIGGDYSSLLADFGKAQSAAQTAGGAVARAFESGASTGGAASQAFNGVEQSLVRVSQATQGATLNFRYLLFGAKDIMEGRFRFAVAEAVNELSRFGPVALAAGLSVGVLGLAIYQALSIPKEVQGIKDAFRGVQSSAVETNDSLRVANDRLENEIAKIEKKPENGIKIALDEAILSADQLGKALDKDIAELSKLLKENKVGIISQIFGQAGTGDIEEEIRDFQRKLAEASKTSIPRQSFVGGVSILSPELLESQKVAAQTQTNTRLTQLYSSEIQKLSHELASTPAGPFTVDAQRRIELIKQTVADLRTQLESVGLKTTNANLQGDKTKSQIGADNQRRGNEELKKADSERLRAEEDAALALEANRKFNIASQINYWRAVLETERAGSENIERINTKILELQKQQGAAFERLLEHGTRAAEEAQKKAQAEVKKWEEIVQEGIELGKKISTEDFDLGNKINKAQTAGTDIGAKIAAQRAESEAALRKIEIEEQYKLSLDHSTRAAIAQAKAIQAVDKEIADAKIAQMRTEKDRADEDVARVRNQPSSPENTLAIQEAENTAAEKQLALEKAIADEIDRQYKDAANVAQIRKAGSLGGQISGAAQAGVGQLSNAIATGVLNGGRGLGKDIRQSLAGIGREMLGDILKKSLEELVVAITGNTIAVNISTIWTHALAVIMAIKSFLGFAGGTDSAPGGWSMIGERGPELMYVPQGSKIIPNHRIAAYADGVGYSSVVSNSSATNTSSASFGDLHFHAHGVTNPRQLAEMAVREIPHVLKARGVGIRH